MLARGSEGQIWPRYRAAVVADSAASFQPETARIRIGWRSPAGSSNTVSGSLAAMENRPAGRMPEGTPPCKPQVGPRQKQEVDSTREGSVSWAPLKSPIYSTLSQEVTVMRSKIATF